MKTLIKNTASKLLLYTSLVVFTASIALSCSDTDYTFVPEPIVAHTITGISPTIGDIGYEVTITGTNFSQISSNNKVSFNGVIALVLASTPSSITVNVPEGATSGDIIVSHATFTANGGGFTVVSIPIIDSFSPDAGEEGQEVIITGQKFSTTPEENLVWFNGTAATVTASTETSISVMVPSEATTGPIKVEVNGQQDTSSSDFIVATVLSITLTSNDDDVEEVAIDFGEPVGTMDLGSSDLELGEISSGQGLMNIGLRFNNVTIAQGTTIIGARIQFNADNTGANPVEVTIYGENVDNAAPYTETLGDLSSRSLTTANEVWNIPEWVDKGDRGDAQKTIDISSIIQEIVSRSDWVSGNSINIIIKHTGVSTGATESSGGREAENYSSSKPNDGAELIISYQ